MRRRGTTTRGPGARGRVAAVAGLAGLAVGLAGLGACDGGPEPAPSVTRTPVASPSPEPTPTPTPVDPAAVPPERPAAMDQIDEAGAEAVARYFLDLYAYVYATGDLQAWRELSHPECVFCASVVTNVEEQVAAGHRSEGGSVDVQSLSVSRVSADFFGVEVVVNQDAGREFDGEGVLVEESPAQALQMNVALVPGEAGWLVRGVQVDPAPAA